MFWKRKRTEYAGDQVTDDSRVVDERDDASRDRGARARSLTRALTTLIGVAAAGLLIWLATTIGAGSNDGYWAIYGLLAAAGLALALSQLLGGWTKWGVPRISGAVFLLGFFPALVAGGWLLLAHQPDANWFRTHTLNWASDVGLGTLVEDLREYLPVIGFGLGLLFGFTFDTSGPRVARRRAVVEPRREVEPTTVEEDEAAEEPTTAERRTVVHTPHGDREAEVVATSDRTDDAGRWPRRRRKGS